MEKKIGLMFFPLDKAKKLDAKYLFIGKFISKLLFSLKYDLQKAELTIEVERYCLAAVISAVLWGITIFIFGIPFAFVLQKQLTIESILIAGIFGFFGFLGSLILLLFYPRILTKKIATAVDQDLLFALRSMLIQLSSGLSLYETLVTTSKAKFGQVSLELQGVVNDISSGMSEEKALEKLTFRTKSEFLKRATWQIVTSMKSGGSLVTSLTSEVDSLIQHQSEQIKLYSAELNLWILVYLIVAAALPSLGVTFLVIISSVSGGGVGIEMVYMIIILSLMVQLAMIMIIKNRIPRVVRQ